MAFDEKRGVMVVFGGASANGGLGDTWTWDGTDWTLMPTSVAPAPRSSHAMAYDGKRKVIVLFGGGYYLNDTWVWNGTSWSPKNPSTKPPGRWGHVMVYDAAREQVVMFGGVGSSGTDLGDTWTWDGSNWTQNSPPIKPSPRHKSAAAFDPFRQEVVLFGGLGFADTWAWGRNGEVPGLTLRWPVRPDPSAAPGKTLDLGQSFSEFGLILTNHYHTGIDIARIPGKLPDGVIQGAPVYPAAVGSVVKIQLNAVTCTHKTGGGACEDHGLGNTVIVRHTAGTAVAYTQYSHLDQITSALLQACGPLDQGKMFRYTCANPVAVDTTTQIGTVGGSGYGCPSGLPYPDGCPLKYWPNYWPPHLHFELKDLPVLGDFADDGSPKFTTNWGYTNLTQRPDARNYHDPVLNFQSASDIGPPLPVIANQSAPLRIGAGGVNAGIYRSAGTLNAGDSAFAIGYSPGTTTGGCHVGWYQLVYHATAADFLDAFWAPKLIGMPSTWFCADFASTPSQPLHPAISITPTSGKLGVTVFTKSGSGFTPNITITQNLTYPDGGVNVHPVVTDANGNFTITNLVYNSQTGTYTDTDVDNRTGSRSNTITWVITP
jgi:murein DD-endopeptidase MepM/ murein hydrolase activator NlpD